jgi:hypothetical protein
MNINRQQIVNLMRKGPKVVIYVLWKVLRECGLIVSGYWPKLENEVRKFWNVSRIDNWKKIVRDDKLLIGPSKLEAFRDWCEKNSELVHSLKKWSYDIRKGKISIFDNTYEFSIEDLPWHNDWRVNYKWQNKYFRKYKFYDLNKKIPYDVKFPWELSRLTFLIPLTLFSSIRNNENSFETINNIVGDWENRNSVAYSVNWFPMECSMRGIILSLVAQMVAANENCRVEHLSCLLRQITLHGEFLFKNVEGTIERNNHYVANLVALLVMGETIKEVYGVAASWSKYAAKRICNEIESQFYSDGINFEKAIGYHRLVTELCILALIIMHNSGFATTEKARKRIYRACEYTKFYIRPDGLAPNLGDNDSSRLLVFDHRPIRDHRPLLSLAAAFFSDSGFKYAAREPSCAIPWLLGTTGVRRWNSLLISGADHSVSHWFQKGGILVSRADNNYLISDFGEVGARGLGGHGHNDTFSFELALRGKPLIIDPGSPVYTGSLTMLRVYASTGYHNTVRIDGKEMARILGIWRISHEATPSQLFFRAGANVDVIEGVHKGYTRLTDPVIHKRELNFYKCEGHLVIRDSFRCNEKHCIERFMHFAHGTEVTWHGDTLCAHITPDIKAVIRWTPGARAFLEEFQVSENYGHLISSQRLILEHHIMGETELFLEVVLNE